MSNRKVDSIRNSRFVITAILLSACVGFVAVPCFAVLALATLSPPRAFRPELFLSLLGWAVAAQGSGAMGFSLGRRSMALARSSITAAGDGVYFRLASPATHAEIFLAWSEIRRIEYQRDGQLQVCSVFGPGDRVVKISSPNFLRPRAIARRIGAWAGISVMEK